MVFAAEHAQEKSMGAAIPIEETNSRVHRNDVGL
jgi:hypothetical protein